MDEYVKVDMGYGPHEHWERVKVIRQEQCKDLFDENLTHTELVIERHTGEQLSVITWRKEKGGE